MKTGKEMLSIKGIVNTLSSLMKKQPKKAPAMIVSTKPEKLFNGVAVSTLNALAREVYHGVKCTIDSQGFLWFYCKSKRGHQTLRTQMYVNETNKLVGWVHHYPGEIWSSADEFIKRANETFNFKK